MKFGSHHLVLWKIFRGASGAILELICAGSCVPAVGRNRHGYEHWQHLRTHLFSRLCSVNPSLPTLAIEQNMPTDDYASASTGGALKLKGAKVQKAKKKKKSKSKDKDQSANLERSLASGDAPPTKRDDSSKDPDPEPEPEPEPEYKTEAERRHEEAMKKKVRHPRCLVFIV